MKICSWNCNGAFRNKWEIINAIGADVFVIQECEKPIEIIKEKFECNYIWTGIKSKGLGIFVKNNIIVEENNWEDYGLEWFISCTLNNHILLIGLWGCRNYIEDIYLYLRVHFEEIKKFKHIVICGDFNSNTIWDKKHIRRSHSDVVSLLNKLGLVSSYHYFYKQSQGTELIPTFYMYRNKEKPYHIDYIFSNYERISNLEIGRYGEWMKYSDHMPITIDLDYREYFNEVIRN